MFVLAPDAELVGVSDRDILLQLYVERKIHRNHLWAGRYWQHYMQEVEIQSLVSIDPGCLSISQYQQSDGDLCESQHRAMIQRRFAERVMGPGARGFLDYALSPDRGRARIIADLHIGSRQLTFTIRPLLEGLSIFFGYSLPVNKADEPWERARDECRSWKIRYSQDKDAGAGSVVGLIRTEEMLDSEYWK